jgi:nucleotide-binding universal stress UspA family protein
MRASKDAVRVVVVGVDGSGGSRTALRFAASEAHLRGANLRVVTAWFLPMLAHAAGFTAGISSSSCERDAESLSLEAIREAHKVSPDIKVEALIVEDEPTAALLAAAVGAELLVVGPEGHGRIARYVLGLTSIDSALVQQALCPVAIVNTRCAPML